MDVAHSGSADGVSVDDFIYYAIAVTVTLYTISYSIEFVLKRSATLPDMDISLIARRMAAVSINVVVLALFAQSAYVLAKNNRFLVSNLPERSSYEFWNHHSPPKNLESELQRAYFYLTKTDIAYSGYRHSNMLLSAAMTINAAFNAVDMFLMYFWRKGFCAENSSLLIFYHWIMIWIECCVFNLDLLHVHPDWNWLFSIIGVVLSIGCISDLLLHPTTVTCLFSVEHSKGALYKKLLWFHLLFSVILMRGAFVSMLAFDFIVTMWQADWTYGAAFQIAIIFLWLQWNNLGKAIWQKINSA